MPEESKYKAGARLYSSVCTAQFIVVRGTTEELDLRCGGHPLATDGSSSPAGSPDASFSSGSLLGKRYVNEHEAVELLCTKPGEGSLSVGSEAMAIKSAKALPASD